MFLSFTLPFFGVSVSIDYVSKHISERQKRIPNSLYGCETTVVFTLKIESVPKNIVFGLKNDGEKWSRKIYFEIPPCGKMVIFVTEFVIFLKTSK